MKVFSEFKKFAIKGNMIDMAIGIIIGASFKKVIDVLVKNVLLPPLSLLSNGISLEDKELIISQTEDAKLAIGYGLFIEALLDLLIIGFVLFIVVKFMNKLKDKSQDVKDTTTPTPKDIQYLSDLKDIMTEQSKILKTISKNLNKK